MDSIVSSLRNIGSKKQMKILDKALILFIRRGISKVGLADISEVTGYSIKEIKRYYKDEEELIDDIVKRAASVSNESTMGILNIRLSAKEKFKFLISSMLDGILMNNSLKEEFAFMLLLQMKEGQSPRYDSYSSIPVFVLAEIIKEGQRDNEFIEGNPEQLSIMFWAFFEGLCATLIGFDGIIKVPSAETVCHVLLR